MKPPNRRALQVLTVALSAYYAIWACAPAASFRPITHDLDLPDEVGLGGTFVGAPGGVPCYGPGGGFCGPSAAVWIQRRTTERFSVGGTIFAGATTFLGGGLQVRYHLLETDRWRLGADAEAGFLWGAVGLPVSLRLVDDLFLTATPSVGLRIAQPARVPLGIAWGVTDTFWLQAEVARGFYLIPGYVSEDSSWSASLAASKRF